MHYRISAPQRLDGLAQVGEVSDPGRIVGMKRGDHVHIEHLVPVLIEVGDYGPARLATSPGNHDALHNGPPWVPER